MDYLTVVRSICLQPYAAECRFGLKIHNDLEEMQMLIATKEKEVELRAYELMKDQENLNLIEQEINDQLKQLFEKGKLTLTEAQKEAYTTVGGVPHLDGDYTVFGEVIEGQDIVDRIAALKRDERDRPLKDVVILKMK